MLRPVRPTMLALVLLFGCALPPLTRRVFPHSQTGRGRSLLDARTGPTSEETAA
jgi:hypothetical protein